MPPPKRVQAAHISSQQLKDLHRSLIDIMGELNRPQRDEYMVRAAGISLEGVLFPLLVSVERLGPIGLVELADRAGRDYTTVSRQISRLEALGLVRREANTVDRRVRKVAITPQGKTMTNRIDAARERFARAILDSWEPQDFEALLRLMRKLADALQS
ncbi:MarR family winged helix-turn-helix transcriptional regulator [Steroidobacter agaridevorans]|uniref:MarR family winged helix-turn-helix transcriptional regulator n=1 Tax=Steroidobacter agaridevorans TaxID=2695856 RepID=UPI00132571AA|nr:MarR family winged helix-turn-helix transcriptional regulator [Steroidobacter agaridevorans]GFE87392.1 transcriptional regulator [Steroidobacter agaridevorans]